MNTLKAEKRDMSVKAKKLRREGYVTGNVFGREMKESVPVKIDKAEAERLLKVSGKGSQIMLDLEGQMIDVLIKEVDFIPMKGVPAEIDFQALVSNEKVHSVAEIQLVNHDKVAAGIVEQLLNEVAFKAYPADLVDKIKVDVGDMKLGDTIKVADLDIAKNPKISLSTDLEAPVVTVSVPHNQPIPETEAEAEAEAEAEGTAAE